MNSENIIKMILEHLPRHSEEGGHAAYIKISELKQSICQLTQIDVSTIHIVINLVESLLNSIAVFDQQQLKQGYWQFVSFPAQLLAMSLLQTWQDKNQCLLDTFFWETNNQSNSVIEKQRHLLRTIEKQRVAHHQQKDAKSIRFIYVAWGMIKLNNNILLYRREDTYERQESHSGNYGLIGGRVNLQDIQTYIPEDDNLQTILVKMQQAESEIMFNSLESALQREIQEEIGLCLSEHYHYQYWHDLSPYQDVQGSRSNHALTTYYIRLFTIQLTLSGFLRLQQQINKDTNLTWFSIDELIAGKSSSGKTAYIEAIYQHYKYDQPKLKQSLQQLEPSYQENYHYLSESKAIIIPNTTVKSPLQGKSGIEKNIDIQFNSVQLGWLLGLAAHSKGLLTHSTNNIILHSMGWIECLNGSLNDAICLTDIFAKTSLPLVEREGTYFRLSIAPEIIYFDPDMYRFKITEQGTQKQLTLTRIAYDTPLGHIQAAKVDLPIGNTLSNKLHQVMTGNLYKYDDEELQGHVRKVLGKQVKALGLRIFVALHHNQYYITCPQQDDT